MVGTVRVVEDSLAFLVLSLGILLLLRIATMPNSDHNRALPLILLVSMIPFWLWKGMGAFRRLFIDKSTQAALYEQVHHIGEMMETLSGAAILIAIGLLIIIQLSSYLD